VLTGHDCEATVTVRLHYCQGVDSTTYCYSYVTVRFDFVMGNQEVPVSGSIIFLCLLFTVTDCDRSWHVIFKVTVTVRQLTYSYTLLLSGCQLYVPILRCFY
jgi:hypothetical protein